MSMPGGRLRLAAAAAAASLSVPAVLVGVDASAELRAPPPATANDTARSAVDVAIQQMGKPWRWGAKGPSAFDASGLVTYSYGRAGLDLPHGSFHQYRSLTPVEGRGDVLPGDLVFSNDGECGRVSAVAIVIDKDEVVRASSTAGRVVRSTLNWVSVVGIGRPSPARTSLREAKRVTAGAPGTVRPKNCPPDGASSAGPPVEEEGE